MTDDARVAGPQGPATAPRTSDGTADAGPATASAPGSDAANGAASSKGVVSEESPTDGDGTAADAAEEPTTSGGAADAVEGEVLDATEPATGATATEESAKPALGAELEALRTELEERTRDLQRVTAEYANYRKRVDRDRALVVEQATGNVLGALLPVLDDLDRAREHGDLVGPFSAVAEQLTTALTKFGLTAFGAKGDAFDPQRHEAVAHLTSAEVTEPTCIDVMRRGYLLGERLLRPALVAVADPE